MCTSKDWASEYDVETLKLKNELEVVVLRVKQTHKMKV